MLWDLVPYLLKNAQAVARLNPVAHLAVSSEGGGALLTHSLAWYYKIRQFPSCMVAKGLNSGASLSGFKP